MRVFDDSAYLDMLTGRFIMPGTRLKIVAEGPGAPIPGVLLAALAQSAFGMWLYTEDKAYFARTIVGPVMFLRLPDGSKRRVSTIDILSGGGPIAARVVEPRDLRTTVQGTIGSSWSTGRGGSLWIFVLENGVRQVAEFRYDRQVVRSGEGSSRVVSFDTFFTPGEDHESVHYLWKRVIRVVQVHPKVSSSPREPTPLREMLGVDADGKVLSATSSLPGDADEEGS